MFFFAKKYVKKECIKQIKKRKLKIFLGETTNGIKASTNGNATGIYDMSGGAYEYVAAYVNNEHDNLTTYGASLVNGAAKYKNVYSIGSSDTKVDNYAVSTPANKHYGDAVWETSSSASGSKSWYGDYSNFPYSNYPFFIRGGGCGDTTDAGVFYFNISGGTAGTDGSFRVVVPVL